MNPNPQHVNSANTEARLAALEAVVYGAISDVEEVPVRTVAARLKCSQRTVLNLIYQGDCPARRTVRPNGSQGPWLVRADWLANRIIVNNPDNPTNQEQDPR